MRRTIEVTFDIDANGTLNVIGDAGANEIESALEEAKKAIGGNDPVRINATVDRLTAASYQLAKAIYRSA